MIHVICRQNGIGRSGHALNDLFSSIAMASILKGKAVYNDTWKNQHILPHENLRNELVDLKDSYCYRVIFSPKKPFKKLVSIKYAQSILQHVRGLTKNGDSLLLRIENSYRLLPFHLHTGTLQGRFPEGSYDAAMRQLNSIYWGESSTKGGSHQKKKDFRVAIHIRRGDVANPDHSRHHIMGPGTTWDTPFYQQVIDDILGCHPQSTIEIYSEHKNSSDLDQLSGAKVYRGGKKEIQVHFNRLVSADVFVPAPSSFSTWAAYLSRGTVRVYQHRRLKQLDHRHYPSNFEIIS